MSEPKRRKIVDKIESCGDEGQLENPVNTNSGPEGHVTSNNNQSALEMLPPKLWELIFEKLDNPKDLLSCRNAALTSAWSTALLSADFCFKMTLPYVLPYLNGRALLQCSSVSKSWNATVDVALQNAEDEDSESDSRLAKDQRIVLTLTSANMSDFISTFGLSTNNTPRRNIVGTNPVVFRKVKFSPTRSTNQRKEDLLKLKSNMLQTVQILNHVGPLIRSLYLSIEIRESAGYEMLKSIRNCLVRTPNLRVLHISTFIHYDRHALKRSHEAFHAHISRNPWPALEHFQVLKFDIANGLRDFGTIANAYAPQLVHLEIDRYLLERVDQHTRFPCLQKLVYSNNHLFHCGIKLGALVRSSQCPLENLTIGIEFCSLRPREHLDDWMRAMTAASASLETLVLLPKAAYIRKWNHNIGKLKPLRLPKLKVLKSSSFGYPSLQFLQSLCPGLQQLTLKVLPNDTYPETDFEMEMYSDLYSRQQFWNELKHIQSVYVEYRLEGSGIVRKLYTRRDYELKVKQDRQLQQGIRINDQEEHGASTSSK